MTKIQILKAGILTTIQDFGRIGYQQYGIPTSGGMDLYSLELANLLVGNQATEGALEFTMMPPSIAFHGEVDFAVTGGDFQPLLNNHPITMYQTQRAYRGDILSFKGLKSGCRGYLAVAGGFDIPIIMGSKSTYLRGAFGGLEGKRLKDGDLLQLNKPTEKPIINRIPHNMIPDYTVTNRTIRVVMGPEDDTFTPEGKEVFLHSQYQLTNQADRMGLRFDGPKVSHTKAADIVSGGINLGAIQVPGEGKPIIMMADHQTTGGYTKIANVISVDIPYLAQLKPGDSISFKEVSIEEAQELLAMQRSKIDGLKNQEDNTSNRKNLFIKSYNINVNGRIYKVDVEELKG
ncbi:5-oxoprolinase subunit C family protein [Alkaliphilus serpentinus]|uniref:Biotin-dependent carboxyltransferase family protein n=1 Tax=Alkaliphilus serpentinus TaxID=1482731 RepID=A0A833HQ63_9FIRM|nr:biotin-dependent carboxyltransferase family protein [Alkaliphilus serpentinus]KAB3531496.1 biotin-dependent carboxyltransferase family protein [Alkaliphilus serpentinus]